MEVVEKIVDVDNVGMKSETIKDEAIFRAIACANAVVADI